MSSGRQSNCRCNLIIARRFLCVERLVLFGYVRMPWRQRPMYHSYTACTLIIHVISTRNHPYCTPGTCSPVPGSTYLVPGTPGTIPGSLQLSIWIRSQSMYVYVECRVEVGSDYHVITVRRTWYKSSQVTQVCILVTSTTVPVLVPKSNCCAMSHVPCPMHNASVQTK